MKKNIRFYSMYSAFTLIIIILFGTGLVGTASICQAQGDSWTEKAWMPTPRRSLSTSVVNGKIYAIGGVKPSTTDARAEVEQYDPATNRWIRVAPMLTPRQWLSTSVVNGIIYAIGGTPKTYAPNLPTVEVYDPVTDTWTTKAPMQTARFTLSTSVVDGKIYAIGGMIRNTTGGDEQPSSKVEAYDPTTDTWVMKTSMPTARAFLTTCVVNGKIYGIGGTPTSLEGISTLEYTPPFVTGLIDLHGEDNPPTEFILYQNYPNPFNPETAIGYQLTQPGRVVLQVFTMLGQELRTLVDEIKPAGSSEVLWDGRDNIGQLMPSGVYLYRIEGQGLVLTRKMVLLE